MAEIPGRNVESVVRKYVKPAKGAGIGLIDHATLWDAVDRHGKVLSTSGLLPDWAIREFISIDPFVDYGECPKNVVSYGITSGGYDIRVGYKFKVFTNAMCEVVSPRRFPEGAFLNVDLTPKPKLEMGEPCRACGSGVPCDCSCCWDCGEYVPGKFSDHKCKVTDSIKIPPNSFALAETIETVYIPRNVMCVCLGKSTYARCGIIVNFTPFEPGWWGKVTVEISNSTPLPVEILAGQGIGQCLFFLMAGDPEKGYGDKHNAKYQGQTGLTFPTVK